MSRRLRAALSAVGIVAGFMVLGLAFEAPAVGAQPPASTPRIIPRPNSGAEPESETDPGGWAQYAVMGGIAAGLGVIVILVRRDSRRRLGSARPSDSAQHAQRTGG